MAVKLQNVLAPALPQPCQGVKTPREERLATSPEPWGFSHFFPPPATPGDFQPENTCALHRHVVPRVFWGGGRWETEYSSSGLFFLFNGCVLSCSFPRRLA